MPYMKQAVRPDHTHPQYAPLSWTLINRPPGWTESAPCHAPGVREIFWEAEDELEEQGPTRTNPWTATARARKVCSTCPFQKSCLKLAMDAEGDKPADHRHGIFAGKVPIDRERINKGTYRGARKDPAWVAEARRLRDAGLTVREIAAIVGKDKSSVQRQTTLSAGCGTIEPTTREGA
jgi:hypothetical protein